MAQAVIAYDRDLPEIQGRLPWERPTSYLVKDDTTPTGWREETSGRRPSRLLMVSRIREAVDGWRDYGYPGASEVTRRLFEYWFEQDHQVDGFPTPFRYYFCQREAIETLVWLVEVAHQRDVRTMIEDYGQVWQKDLFSSNFEFQTTMEGRRQIRRYIAEKESEGVQDLPRESLRRLAFKMATGSGKTWVMAMAVVWSYFHRKRIIGSDLSTNFLIVAPNVIVYQRLERDFADGRLFRTIPLIPPEWRGDFSLKVILRGEAGEPAASGNFFLTNIQQIYESHDQDWTPQNAVEALLGKKPAKDLASSQRSMLERLKSLSDLVVMNDEAHHVHDEDLAWNRALMGIDEALPAGLCLWLDFSATPKDQNGMYFPWVVCDYPLAQAVEDRIVKAPLIVTKEDDPKQPTKDPDGVTRANVGEKYDYWLRAAVQRWKEHYSVYGKLGVKPVLFVMTEQTSHADAIGMYLWQTQEFGLKESEVLVIHTDAAGEIRKKDLDQLRRAARDIDEPRNRVKVIVSVMMLREGWDVRNVTVVLGLRPFTAQAEILPEQVIGRGLRLMSQIGPDRTQTLEVLGTRNLLSILQNQLELEGVGAGTSRSDPTKPVIIEPVQERIGYDIAIPITKPQLEYNVCKLSELDIDRLEAIYDQSDLTEELRIVLKMEFATTQTGIHTEQINLGEPLPGPELLSALTAKIIKHANLTMRFAEVCGIVKRYTASRCFGRPVDLDSVRVRSFLSRPEVQDGITKYLARRIAELTIRRVPIEFENESFRLSMTKPFSWRRDLPPLEAKKTIFNYVATYNSFERRFAEFLDSADDVTRFAALGTTEQGLSGTQFRVDYLKPSGAIGFYFPDWVAVQRTQTGDVDWIIETKGREWEGTVAKDEAIRYWCECISERTSQTWQFIRVNQKEFDSYRGPKSLAALLALLDGDKPKLLE